MSVVPRDRVLRIGLVADAHYADKDPAINRYYRQSLDKMAAAVEAFNGAGVDLAIDLGDLIDSGANDAASTARIRAAFSAVRAPTHHLLGNHCVERLSKRAFLDLCGQREAFYSFDCRGIHLVILDGCYRRDGTSYDQGHYEWTDSDIPAHQRQWLDADLRGARGACLVFVHQRLDAAEDDPHRVHSATAVRQILESSGKVLAVFQGHYHRGCCAAIGGIQYVTLPAMAEGPAPQCNGYSIAAVESDGRMGLSGFGTHEAIAAALAAG